MTVHRHTAHPEPSRFDVIMTEEKKHPSDKASPYYLAKSDICVNAKGECIGNGIFAGRDYGVGEQIITLARPLVASLDTERLADTCANCFTWTEGSSIGSRLYVPEGTSVSACGGCKRFRYCSKVRRSSPLQAKRPLTALLEVPKGSLESGPQA